MPGNPLSSPASRCAVVGAGLTGLTAALRLAQAGWSVTVFERYPEPGGLVACFQVGGEQLECLYHHAFATDRYLVDLIGELGLADDLEWLPSRMGIFTGDRLWDFGTPASLLAFTPLPWLDKARFALSTLRLRWSEDLPRFEAVTAKEWLRRHAGTRVWETVWGPLLTQKFAERADEISMAWLWRKVYLRGRSRSQGGMGERLGYLRGSFGRLVDALAQRLGEFGAAIRLASPVRKLRPAPGGVELTVPGGAHTFPLVVFTASPRELLAAGGEALPAGYRGSLERLESTAALCAVLELDRPLTDYYWLNVADTSIPFGGVIEHTNFIPAAMYGGRHVVYLSRYLFPDHPLWHAREEQVWETFLPHLQRFNSEFSPGWILDRHLFRAADAQPVVPTGYSALLPPLRTPVPGLYHACMAQIYPEDRGQNYAIRSGEQAAAAVLADHARS